ncbi:MAG: 3-dehydroquinate synthase [Thermomicrobiales bacterium]
MSYTKRIVLVGFSGTGKSTVALLAADQLGWEAVDIDAEIERTTGKSIPAIFRDEGESRFRDLERAILHAALARDNVVVAAGGGVAAQPRAWDADALGSEGTLTIALDAPPEVVLDRLLMQAAREGEAVERPLLAAADPLARIHDLKADRLPAYDRAALTLSSASATPQVVAGEIASLVNVTRGEPLRHRLEAASGASDIFVGPGSIRRLGDLARDRWPKAQRAWIISDDNVGPLHGGATQAALESAGFTVSAKWVPAGEGSKSLATVAALYDWLLPSGIERGDVVIALGGGMVGDLAGFVAATVLRGVGLVQVPSTLLATVDSSVGGKTGINHGAGKNLIGAFLQPPIVLVDTDLLHSVPPRELRSGWAEVVKHAVIQRSTPGGERNDLTTVLQRNHRALENLRGPAIDYLIWRNIQLKGAVVAADERETGVRAYLNLGHTLGHAIEAADYQLLHGEAVAVGMRGAAALGTWCETCTRSEAERIESLIRLFGLPLNATFDEEVVLQRMTSDKKRVAGRQRFVLPLSGGGVVIRDDVPEEDVVDVLRLIGGAGR